MTALRDFKQNLASHLRNRTRDLVRQNTRSYPSGIRWMLVPVQKTKTIEKCAVFELCVVVCKRLELRRPGVRPQHRSKICKKKKNKQTGIAVELLKNTYREGGRGRQYWSHKGIRRRKHMTGEGSVFSGFIDRPQMTTNEYKVAFTRFAVDGSSTVRSSTRPTESADVSVDNCVRRKCDR